MRLRLYFLMIRVRGCRIARRRLYRPISLLDTPWWGKRRDEGGISLLSGVKGGRKRGRAPCEI